MKIAICAIVKNENLYLREWVEYHKKLGFDKIILYDNNPVDGEYPHQVIGDYIMSGFVDIHNVRGYAFAFEVENKEFTMQVVCYNKCRIEYQKEIDWMAFIDVDEFITIGENEPQNIHDLFLKYDYAGKGAKQVLMSWYTIGNDGILDYKNKPVQKRFTQHVNSAQAIGLNDTWVKSIVDTNNPPEYEFFRGNEHALYWVHSCIENGMKVVPGPDGYQSGLKEPRHDILYVRHYCTKSLWEHVTRRIVSECQDPKDTNYMRMQDFKNINGWSDDHQKILDNFIEYVNNVEDISVKIKINRKNS